MRRATFILISAAVAILLGARAGGAAEDVPGLMEFKNRIYHNIIVEIYHSDGTRVQKSKTIGSMKKHTFVFNSGVTNCKDKNRKFKILRQADRTEMASGQFGFESSIRGGGFSEHCRLDLKGENNKEWPLQWQLENTDEFNSVVTFEAEFNNGGWFKIEPESSD